MQLGLSLTSKCFDLELPQPRDLKMGCNTNRTRLFSSLTASALSWMQRRQTSNASRAIAMVSGWVSPLNFRANWNNCSTGTRHASTAAFKSEIRANRSCFSWTASHDLPRRIVKLRWPQVKAARCAAIRRQPCRP